MNDYFLEIFYVKKQCSKTFRYDIHRFIPLRVTNSASLEESKLIPSFIISLQHTMFIYIS